MEELNFALTCVVSFRPDMTISCHNTLKQSRKDEGREKIKKGASSDHSEGKYGTILSSDCVLMEEIVGKPNALE